MVRYDRKRLYLITIILLISIFKDGGVTVDSEPADLLNVVGPCRRYQRLSRALMCAKD
jgi:hypothetical protein